MTIRVGINGFGRIGRTFLRNAVECPENEFEIVHINDVYLTPKSMAYLLQYDSVHGRFPHEVNHKEKILRVKGKDIQVTNAGEPSKINWKEFNVDIVIEATGYFTTKQAAGAHLKSGAKRVIITAPSEDAPMFVGGVNLDKLKADEKIISNADDTTHCAAILLSLLDSQYKVLEGSMTAVHAATSEQRTVDSLSPTSELRTGRSITNNILPSSTGATQALGHVLPRLEGKINTGAYRVPTTNVSVLDLVVRVENPAEGGYREVLNFLRERREDEKLRRLISLVDQPGVSADFIGNTESAIVDVQAGNMIGKNFIKLVAWYDNEWGYSNRLVELIQLIAKKERERK